MPGRYLLGIDIGGTKTALVIGDMAGTKDTSTPPKIVDKKVFITDHQADPLEFINKILDSSASLLSENDISILDLDAVGISCGGPLDSKSGVIISPPNLPRWHNVPIIKIVESRLEVETFLQNDANAGALAEWHYGAGRGFKNIIFLTFGTGIGAGLILDGRLYSGTNDLAGEVGHIRLERDGPMGYGKPGSFEGFCSGTGIANLARTTVTRLLENGQKVGFCSSLEAAEKITAKDVCEAAASGDEVAVGILRESGKYLGKGLSILIDILNPERIIIGSIFNRCGRFMQEEAERVIAEEALELSRNVCSIVPSRLGENLGDYAALSVALMHY